jgi:hypothetical protein
MKKEENMETDITKFTKLIDPLMGNRYSVNFNDEVKIPAYSTQKISFKNQREFLIVKMDILETVEYTFNPTNILNITDIYLHYLDPVGGKVQTYQFPIKGTTIKKTLSYHSDSLMFTKLIFTVELEKIKSNG